MPNEDTFSWKNLLCIFPLETESLIYAAVIRRHHPSTEFLFCRPIEMKSLKPEFWPANRRILLCNISRQEPHFIDSPLFREKVDEKSLRKELGKFFRNVAKAGHRIVGILDNNRLRWEWALKAIRFKLSRLEVRPSYKRYYHLSPENGAVLSRAGSLPSGLAVLLGTPIDDVTLSLFKKAALLEHGIRVQSFNRVTQIIERHFLDSILRIFEEKIAEKKGGKVPSGRDGTLIVDVEAIISNLSRGAAPLARSERRILRRQTKKEIEIAFRQFEQRERKSPGIYALELNPGLAADSVERYRSCKLISRLTERLSPDCRLMVIRIPQRAREMNGALANHAILLEIDRSVGIRDALRRARVKIDRSESNRHEIGIAQALTPKFWRLLEELMK